jgi:hypothetical protein
MTEYTSSRVPESETRAQAKEMVLGWFDVEPNWGDQINDFYASFPATVEGKSVARPFYLFFAETCLFIDAPFARVNEVKEILAEPTGSPWGIGRVLGAYTYHNVLLYEMILSNPLATQNLIGIFASEAGRKEFEISGEISFVIETETKNEKVSQVAAKATTLRIKSGNARPDFAGTRSAIQDGEQKGKRF